jgi:phosphonatase-like hydrolase
MSGPELVIFDMAGTTLEDGGQVPGAFAWALAAHGIEVTARALEGVRGSSKREAVRGFVPEGPRREALAAQVYETFRAELARRFREGGVREVAGAAETFRALRERGARLALNTGFDRETTALLLDALGWTVGATVDAVVCGDDVARGRPAPDLILRAMETLGVRRAGRVANVGDTTLDLRAGHAAGVGWNVGVLTGAHGRALLESAPHTHLIPSVAELPDIWST